MSGIGSFSQEAYEQLQAAYAAQLLRADEQEAAGVTIGKDTLSVETAPVKNAWLDKTGLWRYPDGKGEYQDVEQKQQDLLAALRNEDGDVEIPSEEEEDLDSMSDEEIDNMVNEILTDLDEEGEGEDDSDESEETDEDSDLSDLTDEELDALIDQILAEADEDGEEEEEEELSAEEIAARIEQLKAELAALTETSEEEEEEEVDEAPEETEGEVEEETETEDDEVIENDEEESPNDESD